jgi:hypothetical protein
MRKIVHHDSSRHASTTGFLDLLFNFLLGFVVLFVLLLAIIKVESSKPGLEDQNEFVVTATWDEGSEDDVDLWARDPLGNIVSFRNRETGLMHLQRDDLGRRNDLLTTPEGKEVGSALNQEVLNVRRLLPGQYLINLHLYGRGGDPPGEPAHVTVRLTKVNPHRVIAEVKVQLNSRGDERTALSFELLESGEVLVDTETQTPFIYDNMFSTGTY